VVMVFDDKRDLRVVLERLGHFFAHESCGKCYPCQMGTQRQKEILARVAARQALPGDVERLQDVGWTMTDASLCGLGQTAASAVLSAVRLWPELFVAGAGDAQLTTGSGEHRSRPRRGPGSKPAARKGQTAGTGEAVRKAKPKSRAAPKTKPVTSAKPRTKPAPKRGRSSQS
jgi:hypothetical protein